MKSEFEAPRGISPSQLLEQVRNTVPFLFVRPEALRLDLPDRTYLRTLVATDPTDPLSHLDYYRLCLSAHHATVATFVPTDVDNAIRFRLWHPTIPDSTVLGMAELVLQSYPWDCTPVSARGVDPAGLGVQGPVLSGHRGEWLSTAAAAYAALRRRAPRIAAEVADRIAREVRREAEIHRRLKKARDGIGLLKAATIIAHNLGDLDRVIEMWGLPDGDPLKESVFRLGHGDRQGGSDSMREALGEAGRLNKLFMAQENHRHFALRGPRCLRRAPDLLIGLGPFLDAWGQKVARHPELSPEEIGAVAEALVHGWDWLRSSAPSPAQEPVGYARALSGLLEGFPGGLSGLRHYVPAKVSRELRGGTLRTRCAIPRRRFEDQWKQMALKAVQG